MDFYHKIKTSGRLDIALGLLVAAVVLTKRLLISPYGINREAPIELEAIFSVLDGGLIYRDFFWYHGFLPIYWHALIFKLFSPEMYYLRLFVTFFATLAAFFAYQAARYFLSPWMAFAAALLGFTGLIIPEHVTGTMMAFCFFTISFYWLLNYCETLRPRSLFFAGLAGGVTPLAQVLPLGFMALAGGLFAIACFGIFGNKGYGKNMKTFLLGYLPLPLIGYGGLALFVPAGNLWADLFPMFSGNETKLENYVALPIPQLLPVLSEGQSLAENVSALNQYLVTDFRWWLIVIVFLCGLMVFLSRWKKGDHSVRELLLLGVLVLYGPLFEMKFIIFLGRANLTPNYINMLPTYILLFHLVGQVPLLKRFTTPLVAGFLLVFFLYPFGKYYAYFSKNALSPDVPYSKWISVSPYKYDLYNKAVGYIRSNTLPDDIIVFAGINHYYSIFSGRKDVFHDNFVAFAKSSIYPASHYPGDLENGLVFEKEIVRKIEIAEAQLILVPESHLKYGNREISPFLIYLGANWRMVERFGKDALMNPYEYESPVLIFKRKL